MTDVKTVFEGLQINHAEIFDDDRYIFMIARIVGADWVPGISDPPEAFAVLHDARKGTWEWLEYVANNGAFASATGQSPDGVPESIFIDANTNVSVFQFDGGHNGLHHKANRRIIGGVNTFLYFGSDLYAGGRSQIYARRTGPDSWEQLRKTLPASRDPGDREHWYSLDAYGPEDIYATGPDRGNGAIWHYDGETWQAQELPQELGEFPGRSIRCAPDGQVYAVGLNGALVRGNAKDGWEVLIHQDNSNIAEVFGHQHMVWFKGQIYLTTLYLMYTPGDGKWEPYRAERGEHPLAYGGLVTNGSIMMLYGEHGASIFDGEIWSPIYAPVSLDDLARARALQDQLELLEEGVDLLRQLRP